MFGLIDQDDAVRGRALARHQSLVEASGNALRRYNAVWSEAGTLVPRQPHLAAALQREWADHCWQRDQTIFGSLDEFLGAEDAAGRTTYWPFVALFLRWESRYPHVWRAAESNLWSPWSRKARLLARLGRDGVPDGAGTDAVELVLTALRRPYRCKDWAYALLARHVIDLGLREPVTALTGDDDPLVALRARFVLDVSADPGRTITRRTWTRWLER